MDDHIAEIKSLDFSFLYTKKAVRLSKSEIMQRFHSFKWNVLSMTSVYLCEPHTIFVGPKKQTTFQFYGPPYSPMLCSAMCQNN